MYLALSQIPFRKDFCIPMKKTHKFTIKLISAVFAVFVLLLLLSTGILYLKFYEPSQRSADFTRLQQETYQGIFLSMYDPEAFPEDIYSTYMGYDVVSCSHRIVSFSDLSDYLTAAVSSGNEVSHIFLVLDPLLLWDSSFHSSSRLSVSMNEKLLSYVDTYPEAEFTILFSAPSLEYWRAKGTDTLDTYCNLMQVLTASLSVRENVSLYFPAGEEWLVANPSAYAAPGDLTPDAARSTMLLVLSGSMRFDAANTLPQFRSLVENAIFSPDSYPDLSDYDIVFFGDSVFGNYQDFASIPGVIHGLTGADCHNYAIGGSTATLVSAEDDSFSHAVQNYLTDHTASGTDSEKLYFIINYGLNDYFDGYALENYCTGLRNGIEALQEAYPDAGFLIVSSNYILSFDCGTALNGDSGKILTDYVTAAEETAAAVNADFLNINDVLQWNADNAAHYLADSVHPNEEGRFLFGRAVAKALGTFVYPEQ